MSPLTKILGKKSMEIRYRWKVEGTYTGWATYKRFKSLKKLKEEWGKLSEKQSEFVEYQIFN